MIEVLKFGLVGISNTIVYLTIYFIFIKLGIHYLIANFMGYLISSMCGYILNKIWVFEYKKNILFEKSLYKYYITYIIAFGLNISLLYYLVDIIKISEMISPLLILCITVPFNFFMSKYWVYKK